MEAYLWILWDLAAVGLLIYFVASSASHGFVRTVISLLGYAVAALVANFGSPLLAATVYEHIVRDALRMVLMNRLEELLAGGGAAAAEILEQIPQGLLRIMSGDALQAADTVVQSEAAQMVELIIDAALREPVLSILQGLFFLLLFSVVLLVVRRVSRMFTGVYKIPVIGTINTLLGGIFGVAQAVLALAVFSMLVQLLILFTGGYFWVNPQVMEDTYIWRVFYNMLAL